ncbi:MAG: DUF2220 domain-containing protein [Bacillales bacterium]|nr:DUF2220 domain-containing protein [Bacillales bacterium]
MNLENEILNSLLNSYEKSMVSKGLNKVRKDIKLDITNDIFETYRNDTSGTLDIVIERIKRDGFANAIFTRDGQFQCLVLNLEKDSISNLYKKLGRIDPNDLINDFIVEFENQKNGSDIIKSFSIKMIELLNDKKLSSVHHYVQSPDEIKVICKAINAMSDLENDVQERIFCAKLFSDSKRFNELRGKISKIIRDFSNDPYDEEEDVIASMGVIKNTAYAFVKGNMSLKINDETIDLRKYGEPLALSDSAIKNLEVISINANKLFTVENLTSFDVFNEKDSIVLYLGGFHNRVKRNLIEKIYKKSPSLTFYHYGDIDAGGFYILNHLRNKTHINFVPYKMGIEELIKYRNNCKKLTQNDRKRLIAMLDNPDFSDFKDTIQYMLNENIKLEQEAEN